MPNIYLWQLFQLRKHLIIIGIIQRKNRTCLHYSLLRYIPCFHGLKIETILLEVPIEIKVEFYRRTMLVSLLWLCSIRQLLNSIRYLLILVPWTNFVRAIRDRRSLTQRSFGLWVSVGRNSNQIFLRVDFALTDFFGQNFIETVYFTLLTFNELKISRILNVLPRAL